MYLTIALVLGVLSFCFLFWRYTIPSWERYKKATEKFENMPGTHREYFPTLNEIYMARERMFYPLVSALMIIWPATLVVLAIGAYFYFTE